MAKISHHQLMDFHQLEHISASITSGALFQAKMQQTSVTTNEILCCTQLCIITIIFIMGFTGVGGQEWSCLESDKSLIVKTFAVSKEHYQA